MDGAFDEIAVLLFDSQCQQCCGALADVWWFSSIKKNKVLTGRWISLSK